MKISKKVFFVIFLVVFAAEGVGAQVLVDSGYPISPNAADVGIIRHGDRTIFETGEDSSLIVDGYSSYISYGPRSQLTVGFRTFITPVNGHWSARGFNIQAVMEFILYETTLDSLTPYNFTARLGQFSITSAQDVGDPMSVGLYDLGDDLEDGYVSANDFDSVREHIATLFTHIPAEGTVFDNIDVTEALRHDLLTGEILYGEDVVPAVITGFLLKNNMTYRQPGRTGTCSNFLDLEGEGRIGFPARLGVRVDADDDDDDDLIQILLMPDSDGDGVNDLEDGYPEDAGRATPPSSEGSGNLTIATDSGTLRDVEPIEGDNPCLANVPDDLVFADGLVSYRITGLTLGETVTVQLSFPSGVSGDFYKADCEGYFQTFPYTLIDSNTIEITLTDGGFGDLDGVENGEILDPGGMGEFALSGGSDSEKSNSSHSHCFISTLGF